MEEAAPDLWSQVDPPAPAAPPVKYVPPVPKRPVSYAEYEAACAASRQLSIPDFREWCRETGYGIVSCRCFPWPACQGWHLADSYEQAVLADEKRDRNAR